MMNKLKMMCLSALLIAPAVLLAQKVTWKVSTPGHYWLDEHSPKWSNTSGAGDAIEITDSMAQTIDGWGGTFSEIGWNALSLIPEQQRQQVLNDLFGPDGLKFNLCRLPMGANDLALSYYSYCDVDADFKMVNFNIDRDRYILIPFVHAAQRVNPSLRFWSSPWSPPAWMKINNHYACEVDHDATDHNGMPADRAVELPCTALKMQTQYLQAYALYFSKYVQAYAQQGVPIDAVCIQNEPCSTQKYPSCTWRPEDLAYFTGRFLGPQFERDGITTHIIYGTINRDNPDYTRVALSDPQAKKYFKGAGFQWDGKGAIPAISREFPRLKMMHTEAECGNGSNDWAAAEHTWWQISHYLRNGSCNFTYWNMVLDERGSTTWGWRQNALITADTRTGKVAYHPEFYLMKHFGHYLQPAAKRIAIAGNRDDVLAFKNPDGHYVVLLVNQSDATKAITINFNGKSLRLQLRGHSFNTLYI